MSDIDALINELYPEMKQGGKDQTTAPSSKSSHTTKPKSNFDSDDDQPKPKPTITTSTSQQKTGPSDFDGSSDEESNSKGKRSNTPPHTKYSSWDDEGSESYKPPSSNPGAVPFPQIPPEIAGSLVKTKCNGARCVLGNFLALSTLPRFHRHYAFLSSAPRGVHTAGVTEDLCLFVRCLKCDHLVIRLQDAAWEDDQGQKDLYLDMRYHYPDWNSFGPAVLRKNILSTVTDPTAFEMTAAYCCQCTWFTVYPEKGKTVVTHIIETPLYGTPTTSTVMANIKRSTSNLADKSSKELMAPRWVCRGHPLQME